LSGIPLDFLPPECSIAFRDTEQMQEFDASQDRWRWRGRNGGQLRFRLVYRQEG
jgi:hypothetical protein